MPRCAGQVAVVRDEVAAISAEIRAASPNHEVVLTAGGLGPTHDDVTMAGIADALGKPLERSGLPALMSMWLCRLSWPACFHEHPYAGRHL